VSRAVRESDAGGNDDDDDDGGGREGKATWRSKGRGFSPAELRGEDCSGMGAVRCRKAGWDGMGGED